MSSDSRTAMNSSHNDGPIWWPNVLFFCGMHLAAVVGVYLYPLWEIPRRTALLCLLSWQLAVFGITIGYHRLYSHRSFSARRPLRVVLALMGCLGFQGSIKWWCARHRLHHRYTDDPIHDPYCATKGLYHSHMGWIFRKPNYPRMDLIDRSDLENDPVVRFQHKYYIPLTLGLGLVLPGLIAAAWNDVIGGFIWGGIVARLLIWHCTFIVNSFAHWEGLQPYSEDMTARGNLLMAVLTGGEGNHNFHHTFPRDYRASPHLIDWDPSKWIIGLLYQYTGLITSINLTREEDIVAAQTSVAHQHGRSISLNDENAWTDNADDKSLPLWSIEQITAHILSEDLRSHRKVIFVNGDVVDITDYVLEHPGGYAVLKPYLATLPTSCSSTDGTITADLNAATSVREWKDASWAFGGGMNNHSSMAKRKLRSLRVARLSPEARSVLV